MELMKFSSNENANVINSYEFLQVINGFRVESGENEVENSHFLDRVIDELDISNSKTFRIKNNRGNKEVNVVNLTKDDMLLVGMRESKTVRKKVLEYIKSLEKNTAPRTYIEALKALVIVEEEKQRLVYEKNEAIKTKAYISDKKTATAMATASHLKRENNKLNDIIEKYKTQYLTPTELGALIDVSGIAMNRLLEAGGFQYKQGKKWIIKDNDFYCVVETEIETDTFKTTKEQIKWSPKVLAYLDITLD